MAGSGDKWCRHRTPFDETTHPVCKVGIDYNKFPKDFKNMPCLGTGNNPLAICPKYSPLTKEELEDRNEKRQKRFERMGLIRAAIINKIGTASASGTIDCPACKTGRVQFSRASNGHVHAACSTPDCASWME